MPNQFGLIGLGVMGQNLALNIERNGVAVVGYDLWPAARQRLLAGPAAGRQIQVVESFAALVAALQPPRRILLMVPAGAPVDDAIGQLAPLLAQGDVLIDGGNSYFQDTERRTATLAAQGLRFMGLGVSGGAEGALWGPSLMAGGDDATYAAVESVLSAIAARAPDGAPCVAHVGPRGAGHYVKMVHNGIEYGDMQLIAEAYDLLHRGAGLDHAALRDTFRAWNDTELASYLIDITADIFARVDETTGRPLLDVILDSAGQKGTGKWTSQNSLDAAVAAPTLIAAVNSRLLSALKPERLRAAGQLAGPQAAYSGDVAALVDAVRAALYASKVCAYAQGMALLRAASAQYDYGLNLAAIARTWRAGCIIRADFLDDIARAFDAEPDLPNLLLSPAFGRALSERQEAWRLVVSTAVALGIPMPGTMESLAYYDSYRAERLPANLIQAQRDFFGAHTFERVDMPGSFHYDWS